MPTTPKQTAHSPTFSSDSVLIAIPGHSAYRIWPFIERWINDICTEGGNRYKPEDYYMAVIKRDIQLWAIWSGEQLEAVVLTEIIDYPRKRYCNVHGLAGVNHKRWLHLVWNIEEWAKTKGCDGIESAHGRVGFERELKELGWKSAARYFEKEF